ncbi:MAG TPA: SMI1/KNR4 family protein [Polyangia bacterium]|nr:SMI1/KNR4 family protein [Polyangia bacterium]
MMNPLIAKLRERAADASLATDEAADITSGATVPVDDVSIARAETLLGRRLPSLLRDAYSNVGDGGFGPGYGLLRLLPDPRSADVESVVGLYTALCSIDPEDAAWSWPVDLIPFCDWGCAIRTCVDSSTPDGTIITFDPNARDLGDPMSTAFAATHPNLESWFTDWLAGVRIWDRMFEPDQSRAATGLNPFTKEPHTIVPTKPRGGGLT